MNAKTCSIIALVCGIVGIVGSFIPYVSYIAPLAAIAGIIFGAVALNMLKKAGTTEGKGLAVAGLVLGIISTVVSLLVLVACVICTASLLNYANSGEGMSQISSALDEFSSALESLE